jgi:hypothetical protein
MSGAAIICAAVEGTIDEAVARKLIFEAGGTPGEIYGKKGKLFLRQKVQGFNNAARHSPWMVLVDLNSEAECVPPIREEWVPDPAPMLCFRVAVREVEAWLMADAESLAGFLGIARNKISDNPESIADPKTAMVNLARKSRRRYIREDMVPREESGRQVGPAYKSRLIEYVMEKWRPDIAASNADSLRRAIACLRRLVGKPARAPRQK